MTNSTNTVRAIYAYAVCLVAIIALLLSISGLVSSISDLRDPAHAGGYFWGEYNLTSFEMFKVSVRSGPQRGAVDTAANWIPDDDTLRQMYETAQVERDRNVIHKASKQLTTHSIVLLVSLLLFGVHWFRVRPLGTDG